MNYIFILIILIFIFYLINIFLINNFKKIEHFCKIPTIDPITGVINNKDVSLDYPAQSNIFTSSCDKYWKDWALEKNNTMIEDAPIVINSNQLSLPKEKEFADNSYNSGLIDYNQLANIITDNINIDIFKNSEELLIDPITKKKIDYLYELEYIYIENNKKTYINRWEKYNPSIKTYFNYDDIKSNIENINKLNIEFKNRIDSRQKELLSDNQLILYGLVPYEIFKYKILHINYLNSDINKPVYIIQIVLYRESDLYINTFSYTGFFENNNPILSNVKYIGRNSTDSVLLSGFYNPYEIKEHIINTNFDNSSIIEKDPDAIVALTKKQKESYKLKNQYACFDINYSPTKKGNIILPYYSREACESSYDAYGKAKNIGIYDTPCKKNNDCPFYKINGNYKNEFGKCMDDGYCELPMNMERIGYRYFKNNPNKKPLCYNCKSNKFQMFSTIDMCCDEQNNTNKYGFLKTPDYAFEGDFQDRKNYFNSKFCTQNNETNELTCNEFIL